MRRTPLALAAVVAAFAMTPTVAHAAIVPDPPTGCTATATDATHVALSWTPPAYKGDSALKWYAYQRRGDTGTLHTPTGADTSATWVGTYTTADLFRVRAVNQAGFSTWANCTWGGPPPPPAPFITYGTGTYLTSVPTAYGPQNSTLTASMRTYLANVIGTAEQPAGVDYPKIGGVGGNQFGMPYRMSTASSDPVWKLQAVTGGTIPSQAAFLTTTGFHAPADLGDSLTGTSDSPMVVIDRVDGYTVWASKVSKGTGNTINVAGAAGVFWHTSNGLDERRPESNDARNFRSRGVIPDSMVIRKDALDYAVAHGTGLGYVLELFWPETDSSAGFRFPMVQQESGKGGWGAEGQRVGIDPAINLATRSCTPYGLAIARTLQTNGAYIGDNAGAGGMTLKAEQDEPAHVVWGSALGPDELAGCIHFSDFVAYTTPN